MSRAHLIPSVALARAVTVAITCGTTRGITHATRLVLAWLTLCSALLVTACGGGGGSTSNFTGPVARVTASADPTVGEPVILDASGSDLLPGATTRYTWLVVGPDGAVLKLANAGTDKPSFVPTAAGDHTVQLVVSVSAPPYSATSPATALTVTVANPPVPTAAEVRARIATLAASATALLPPDSSSPTVTAGQPNAASVITDSRLVAWDDTAFRYSGSLQVASQNAADYPNYLFGTNRAVSYASSVRSGNYLSIDFVTDALRFEVFQKGLGFNSRMRVVVDGRLASSTPTEHPSDGNLYLTEVRFASAATRHIRLLINNPYFGGVRVGPNDTVSRPVVATRLRTMFFGDSITEGVAGQDAPASYAALAAQALGWQDNWLSGVGSTGYLAAPSPKLTLRQRYATDVKAVAPHVLVVAAGINDTASSDTDIQTEASLLFDQIQADLPQTLVYVTGPWASTSRVRPGVAAALKAAVGTRANFTWVPNVDEAWLTGSGNAGSPNGTGNTDQYVSADGTHPTPAGIDYLATKLTTFIRSSLQ